MARLAEGSSKTGRELTARQRQWNDIESSMWDSSVRHATGGPDGSSTQETRSQNLKGRVPIDALTTLLIIAAVVANTGKVRLGAIGRTPGRARTPARSGSAAWPHPGQHGRRQGPARRHGPHPGQRGHRQGPARRHGPHPGQRGRRQGPARRMAPPWPARTPARSGSAAWPPPCPARTPARSGSAAWPPPWPARTPARSGSAAWPPPWPARTPARSGSAACARSPLAPSADAGKVQLGGMAPRCRRTPKVGVIKRTTGISVRWWAKPGPSTRFVLRLIHQRGWDRGPAYPPGIPPACSEGPVTSTCRSFRCRQFAHPRISLLQIRRHRFGVRVLCVSANTVHRHLGWQY